MYVYWVYTFSNPVVSNSCHFIQYRSAGVLKQTSSVSLYMVNIKYMEIKWNSRNFMGFFLFASLPCSCSLFFFTNIKIILKRGKYSYYIVISIFLYRHPGKKNLLQINTTSIPFGYGREHYVKVEITSV